MEFSLFLFETQLTGIHIDILEPRLPVERMIGELTKHITG